jgi:hypothetical protein
MGPENLVFLSEKLKYIYRVYFRKGTLRKVYKLMREEIRENEITYKELLNL